MNPITQPQISSRRRTLARHARRTLLGLALTLLTVSQAQAGTHCPRPVFFCELLDSTKVVSLCEEEHLVYRFGPREGQPELTLRLTRDEVTITPWNGMGSLYWASIERPNHDWVYRLGVSYPRNEDEDPEYATGTLTVLRDDVEKRRWECNSRTLQERIESLADEW